MVAQSITDMEQGKQTKNEQKSCQIYRTILRVSDTTYTKQLLEKHLGTGAVIPEKGTKAMSLSALLTFSGMTTCHGIPIR